MSSRSVSRGRLLLPALASVSIACATYDAPTLGVMRAEYARAAPTAASREADDHTLAAPKLDRCAFVAAVLDRNPSLAAAREAWRAALAHAKATGALPDPMASVEIAPLSIGSSAVPLGIVARFEQRLPWPEKLMLDDEVAKDDALASAADFRKAQRALALAAAVLYDEYFVAARSIDTNARYVAIAKDLERASEAALAAGRASAQDPLAADTELAHMEHAAMVYAADRDIAAAQMNALLHRDPSAPLPPPVDSLDTQPALVHPASRPEIEAATLRARGERQRAARWRRDWIPDLTLMTSYDTMWPMPEHRWMVGLGLTLPIELGHRAAAADEAEAQAARNEKEAASLTDTANAEVAVARTRSDEAEKIAALYARRLLPSAKAQLDAARAAYETSRTDFETVLAAERGLRTTELAEIEARADLDRRRAELADALGAVACGREVTR